MGGTAGVTLVGGDETMLDRCFELAEECERRWTRFSRDSDLSRLAWAEGGWVTVDPLTVGLIEAMQFGAALTDGDYDPTLLPDLLMAGYVASRVDPARITELPPGARSRGDLAQIGIDGDRVSLPYGMTLDAGGIGKGLAGDLIVALALRLGAWGALADLGGDIVVAGDAPTEAGWTLAVENQGDGTEPAATVALADGAIVTSSRMQRRWSTPEGERHHVIDPRTGGSASTPVRTATVIAATGARAEVLAKPAFLRDPAHYLAWLPTIGAAALLLMEDGALVASDNWGDYL
nr:FAD:protein FMN transferase [Galbitalea soli]